MSCFHLFGKRFRRSLHIFPVTSPVSQISVSCTCFARTLQSTRGRGAVNWWSCLDSWPESRRDSNQGTRISKVCSHTDPKWTSQKEPEDDTKSSWGKTSSLTPEWGLWELRTNINERDEPRRSLGTWSQPRRLRRTACPWEPTSSKWALAAWRVADPS